MGSWGVSSRSRGVYMPCAYCLYCPAQRGRPEAARGVRSRTAPGNSNAPEDYSVLPRQTMPRIASSFRAVASSRASVPMPDSRTPRTFRQAALIHGSHSASSVWTTLPTASPGFRQTAPVSVFALRRPSRSTLATASPDSRPQHNSRRRRRTSDCPGRGVLSIRPRSAPDRPSSLDTRPLGARRTTRGPPILSKQRDAAPIACARGRCPNHGPAHGLMIVLNYEMSS